MSRSATCGTQIRLLGCFELSVDGQTIPLPLGAQRLLGDLAMTRNGINRTVAAEHLWPDSPRGRANANLRSALWQARRSSVHDIVDCAGSHLRLAATVIVDHRVALERTQDIWPSSNEHDGAGLEWLVATYSDGLLIDWTDEWLLVERERWDQIRLHTLESLAQHLMKDGMHLPALNAALAAVAIEPVRESAHRTVIEIFLAEGNAACALKHFQRYRRLVHHELGIEPSRQMMRLVQPIAAT